MADIPKPVTVTWTWNSHAFNQHYELRRNDEVVAIAFASKRNPMSLELQLDNSKTYYCLQSMEAWTKQKQNYIAIEESLEDCLEAVFEQCERRVWD